MPSPTIRYALSQLSVLHLRPTGFPRFDRVGKRVIPPRGYGFRQWLADSPSYMTETGSLYYSLDIPFLLLSTLPYGNAVTVLYGAQSISGRDFHPAAQTRLKAH